MVYRDDKTYYFDMKYKYIDNIINDNLNLHISLIL